MCIYVPLYQYFYIIMQVYSRHMCCVYIVDYMNHHTKLDLVLVMFLYSVLGLVLGLVLSLVLGLVLD